MDPFGDSIFFKNFPDWVQIICGSSITLIVVLAFTLDLVFNHTGRRVASAMVRETAG